jgi:hypothetical protein
MITIKTFASIAAILLPLGSCAAAYAQTAPTTPGTTAPSTMVPGAPSGATKTPDAGMAKLQAACKTDIEKYCGDAGKMAQKAPTGAPGQAATKAPEQLVACMTTNEAKLTATCKTAWTERKAATKGNPG